MKGWFQLKMKWLFFLLAAVIWLPNFASAAPADGHYESFKKEREQKLLQIVKTYTPEKTREWEAALNKRSELKERLHQQWRAEGKQRPHKKHPRGHHRHKHAAVEWKKTLSSKNPQEIKSKLDRMLISVQNHNSEMEKRLDKNQSQ